MLTMAYCPLRQTKMGETAAKIPYFVGLRNRGEIHAFYYNAEKRKSKANDGKKQKFDFYR